MIAATTGGKSVEAGIQMLKEGGSAADAAMTTALCEVVHAGGSYVSFARNHDDDVLRCRERESVLHRCGIQHAVGRKKSRLYPAQRRRTALVPGFLAESRLRTIASVNCLFSESSSQQSPWPKRENSNAVMEWWINSKKAVLSRFPETKKIFTNKDGKFLKTRRSVSSIGTRRDSQKSCFRKAPLTFTKVNGPTNSSTPFNEKAAKSHLTT